MQPGKNNIKPPLGIINRKLYGEFLNEDIIMNGGMCSEEIRKMRIDDLIVAMNRYSEVMRIITIEWIIELSELHSSILPSVDMHTGIYTNRINPN